MHLMFHCDDSNMLHVWLYQNYHIGDANFQPMVVWELSGACLSCPFVPQQEGSKSNGEVDGWACSLGQGFGLCGSVI